MSDAESGKALDDVLSHSECSRFLDAGCVFSTKKTAWKAGRHAGHDSCLEKVAAAHWHVE
jgi:hypothetical protein